ncbi:MAG: hypothetical protein Kow0089_24760 [Desulfobulbaceae bacterium]
MQSLSYALFLFVLLFCPLAFGTVEPWSRFILITATSLSFLILCLDRIRNTKPFYNLPGTTAFLLLLCWMIFQLVPLPPQLVRTLSPSTFELYNPFLETDGGTVFLRLSVNPEATLSMVFIFGACFLFYLLTVQHLASPARLKQTILMVTGLGSLVAVEAIIQKLTAPDAIYWFRVPPSTTPVGPFVYSNHFAGFMEMLFPLAVALFLIYRPRAHYEKRWRDRWLSLFTMPGANRYLLLGTGAVLMAVSILFSLSRGGIITVSVAFLFFILFSARTTKDRRTRWAIFLTAATVLTISWLGWQPILDEFGKFWGIEGFNTSGRLPVLLDAVKLYKRFPLTGTGFGTFENAFPSVRTVPGDSLFDHAHNDYLELLTDGGLIGFALAGWFVAAVLTKSLRTLHRRRDRFSILVTSGALTGLLALLFHCLADFQMYNGANALYFFFFCGLAVAASSTRLQFRTRPNLLSQTTFRTYLVPTLLALLLPISANILQYRQYKARTTAPPQSLYLNHHIPAHRLESLREEYARANGHDPLADGYLNRQGEILLLLGRPDEAAEKFRQAALLRPMSGLYPQQLALTMKEDPEQAENYLRIGIEREPRNIRRFLAYADWLKRNKRRAEALEIVGNALAHRPDKAGELAAYLMNSRFALDDLETYLPRAPQLWYELGRIAERRRLPETALRCYLVAVNSPAKQDQLPAHYGSPISMYMRMGEKDLAIALLREAIERFPDYAPFRVQLGDYYRQENIPYRAREEYLQALRLDPDYGPARQRVAEMESVQ